MQLKRDLIVTIDGKQYTDPLKITVTITKDNKADDPDEATITLYNLNVASRSSIIEGQRVEVYAGYNGNTDLAFMGDVLAVSNAKKSTEWVTEIHAGDGAVNMKRSVINKSYKKPLGTQELIEDIAKSAKPALCEQVEFVGIEEENKRKRGTVHTGRAWREIERLCKPRGWTCNIQNGTLVVAADGKGKDDKAYVISVDTGMINSPEWINIGNFAISGKQEKPQDRRMRVEVLAMPTLEPSDKVRIKSDYADGKSSSFIFKFSPSNALDEEFVVERVEHQLDSREGDFKTIIEASQPKQ